MPWRPMTLALMLGGCAQATGLAAPAVDGEAQAVPGNSAAGRYPTIETAPPYPAEAEVPPAPADREGGRGWYATTYGVSDAEAQRRVLLQRDMADEIGALDRRLRRSEGATYGGLWIEHRPDWRVVVAFTRSPEATLRRYTRNPVFAGRQVRWSKAELERAMREANAQIGPLGIPYHGGTYLMENEARVELGTEQSEVERLLASGRLRLPPAVRLVGLPPLEPRDPLAPEAAAMVRIFPQLPHRTTIETQELNTGWVVLREGCLRLDRPGTDEDPLAYFGRESGLKLSPAGRLAIYNRASPDHAAQIGERMVLGGGAGREIVDEAVLAPIRAACGAGPVVYVGNPHSYTAFKLRHSAWRVNDLARREGVSRDEALRRYRACLAGEAEAAERYRRTGIADMVPPCDAQPPPPPPPPPPRRR
ncbi:MAG TPA: hypothetical protein VGB54_13945 [Allosphingosinicella sp.]